MEVEYFKPEHLDEIELSPAVRAVAEDEKDCRDILAASVPAVTCRIDRKIVLCTGVIGFDPKKGWLWSFESIEAQKHSVAVHRFALRFLEVSGKKHLCASTDNERSAHWLERLGFRLPDDPILKEFGPDRRDHLLYVFNT